MSALFHEYSKTIVANLKWGLFLWSSGFLTILISGITKVHLSLSYVIHVSSSQVIHNELIWSLWLAMTETSPWVKSRPDNSLVYLNLGWGLMELYIHLLIASSSPLRISATLVANSTGKTCETGIFSESCGFQFSLFQLSIYRFYNKIKP